MRVKLVSVFFLLSIGSFSQSIQRNAMYSGGGFASSGTFSIQSNIGELMVETYSVSPYDLSQGFVQPTQSLALLTNNKDQLLEVIAFPNPVAGTLSVQLSGISDASDILIEVYDIIGQKQNIGIIAHSYDSSINKYSLDLKELSSGIYFIKISSLQKKINKTLKINKL